MTVRILQSRCKTGPRNRRMIAAAKRQIWQAELIGWPGLAESLRRTLQQLESK